MVTIYNTTLSATSQRHFSDGLGGGYDMVNNNGSTVMPSELYDTLYQSEFFKLLYLKVVNI